MEKKMNNFLEKSNGSAIGVAILEFFFEANEIGVLPNW